MATLKGIGISKLFGDKEVVKNIDIEVRSGEIIALLGRNGAGKTTTFLIMAGLLKPTKGKIFLNSEDITHLPSHEKSLKGIIYIPQEHSVFLRATVAENISLILQLHNFKKMKINKITEEVLEKLGLSHLSKQSAYTLSGGEKRRLEIARAIAMDPKFLLMDEPFSGVDPITIAELQKICLNLKDMGIGILISDHNVRDTFEISDRAYIIHEGLVLVEGSPIEVSSNKLAREKFLGKDFKFGEERIEF
ncbi:MAG: LPS export ABC transporter ATP-binding protein [Candidatus Aminicenantia bacterium]